MHPQGVDTHKATKSEIVFGGTTDVFAVWRLCSSRRKTREHNAIFQTTGVLQQEGKMINIKPITLKIVRKSQGMNR